MNVRNEPTLKSERANGAPEERLRSPREQLAAKDETIRALRAALAAKDETIRALRLAADVDPFAPDQAPSRNP